MSIHDPGYEFYYLVKVSNSERSSFWTSSDDAIVYDGDTYSPVIGMEITQATSSIELEEAEGTIDIASDEDSILTRFTDGTVSPKTEIKVFGWFDGDVYLIDIGYLYTATKNPKNQFGLTRLVYRDICSYFDRPAGISCNAQCMRVFGDSGCRMIPLGETVTCSAVAGNKITISRPFVDSDQQYVRGKIQYAGMSFTIKKWESGYLITLVQPPPESMAGESVTLIQGCDRSLESCLSYDNETNFLGCGYKMVPYSPLSETT